MAKKQFTGSIASIVAQTAAVESRYGLRLSDVVYKSPQELKPNPLNEKFFAKENELHLQRLQQDIQERGILVPLIAKADGTLLAGHNRLAIARELGWNVVPVQYVEDILPDDAERKFVINDNLLRRQLSNEERIELYRVLYPNFDERIQTKAGRPTKEISKKNVDIVHISNKSSFETLTAAMIAADTGQSKAAVQKQLQRKRQEEQEKLLSAKAEKKIQRNNSNSSSHVSNTDIIPDTALVKKIEKNLMLVESSNEATKKTVAKMLKVFAKKLL